MIWLPNSKDSQFKSIVESFLGKSSRRRMNGDLEFHVNDTIYVVEYENSSRGLTSNLVKVALAAEEQNVKAKVLLVYTDHHQRVHSPDLKRAEFLARKLSSENFQASIICENEINDTELFRELLFHHR